MAGGSLLTLLDDIASVLDDVAAMTKVATQKTAGVLGDDLALNAEQVSGVEADRELPVVWAVAKGALINKVILVPIALLISSIAPLLVTVLLMIGGLYLCYEGVEKLFHSHDKRSDPEIRATNRAQSDAGEASLVELEKTKIKGAIRTDFILSAEIIVIALGTIPAEASLAERSLTLSVVALLMTVGVYGLVALIVRLDNIGAALLNRGGAGAPVGRLLLAVAPRLLKLLGFLGMIAMFLVGGGIIAHGIPSLHHWIEGLVAGRGFLEPLLNGLVGIVAGALALGLFSLLPGRSVTSESPSGGTKVDK